MSDDRSTRPKTNRLYLVFSCLSLTVALININFHHAFHAEHVIDSTRRVFKGKFRMSRKETDDYVTKRLWDEGAGNGVGEETAVEDNAAQHKLAGLKCKEKYGGPDDEFAEREMAFWSDIPSDASYKSPFMDEDTERFLTFEPDHGGWNNIRMAMETALVMSHAMGRTLVLPPEKRFYLLGKADHRQKNEFGFGDFFHLDSIAVEHEGFNVISTREFQNRKNVDTRPTNPEWNPMECIAAFPSRRGSEAIDELKLVHENMFAEKGVRKKPSLEEFEGKPIEVDAPMEERMRELLADRSKLCIYDERLQKAQVLHFPAAKGTRLLTHFYAFVFFADWRADLWSKRFVRDHLRYIDEIMCAAARVVEAVRKRSKEDGQFDTVHVRRGDFQYKKTRLSAEDLVKNSREIKDGSLLYIATDERDKSFFKPFKEKHDVAFLDDFKHLLKGINTNYYGMLDQLVASKGRVFYGTWWSTLSGYVNRMRGYYITKHKLEGHEDGTMESYYFFPLDRANQMKQYMPVKKPIYMREFPTSWRDIDRGIDEIHRDSDSNR